MDQYKLRELITNEYTNSLLDGNIKTNFRVIHNTLNYSCRTEYEVKRVQQWIKYIQAKIILYLESIINIRSTQPIVDIILRNGRSISTICIPHLKQDFFLKDTSLIHHNTFSVKELNTKKWNILKKNKLSLDETLLYIILRCLINPLQKYRKKSRKSFGGLINMKKYTNNKNRRSSSSSSLFFKGSLLPISVKTSSSTDSTHANMIFIKFNISDNQRLASPVCYLFDPNGKLFIKKHHPNTINHLQISWNFVIKQISSVFSFLDFNPQIKIIGGDGIQTLLGIKEINTNITRTKSRIIKRQRIKQYGFPICGAITYWTFTKWLQSKSNNYEEFENQLIQKIITSKKDFQNEIYHFIKNIRLQMENSYQQNVSKIINKDIYFIQRYIYELKKAKFSDVSQTFRISIAIHLNHQNKKLNTKIPYIFNI